MGVRQARRSAALAEVADRVTVAPGKIILFGLTEGGQAALELAARAPERYAGAIAITPGHGSGFVSSPPLPRLDDRRFVLVVGSNELRVTDHWAGLARDWLEGNGAQVWYDRVPAKRHQLPDDFVPRIKTWVTHILTGAK
jgi:predicted esterase